MRKFSLFMLMAVGLLISGNVWGGQWDGRSTYQDGDQASITEVYTSGSETTYYALLEGAIKNAGSGNKTIVVLEDANVQDLDVISMIYPTTIDLNGHTVSGAIVAKSDLILTNSSETPATMQFNLARLCGNLEIEGDGIINFANISNGWYSPEAYNILKSYMPNTVFDICTLEYNGPQSGWETKTGCYQIFSENVPLVAQIEGGNSYHSFNNAIKAVPTDNTATTITLLNDVTDIAPSPNNIDIKANTNITLNTNGKLITGNLSGGNHAFWINGKMTINGGGRFIAQADDYYNVVWFQIYDDADLTLEDIYIETGNCAIGVEGGHVKVDNTIIKARDGGWCISAGDWYTQETKPNTAVVDIYNVVFTSVVENPDPYSSSNDISCCAAGYGATINIYGGTFYAEPVSALCDYSTENILMCFSESIYKPQKKEDPTCRSRCTMIDDTDDPDFGKRNSIINMYGGTVVDFNPTDFVAEGYSVNTSTVNDETRYVVHKNVETSKNINEDNQGDGAGQNDKTAFSLSGENILTNDITKAEYVELNGTSTNIASLTVKTDQTLEVGNGGLVVGDYAFVTVEPGGLLIAGQNGVITNTTDSKITVQADAIHGCGVFLLDPKTGYNTQPYATVDMVANIGKNSFGEYVWHRFASPVAQLEKAWEKTPNYGTYLYEWDYETKDWALTSDGSMGIRPFIGYTISVNEPVEEVKYTFSGQLMGNKESQIDFTKLGYGYFGNSYTGHMLAKVLLRDIMNLEGTSGTVWMWNPTSQLYAGVSMQDLITGKDLEEYEKEVAPMHTFILKLNSGSGSTIDIDYTDAIWSNPRYSLVPEPVFAPAFMGNDDAFISLKVSSTSGQTDKVRMTEGNEYSDEYENGVDAPKFMNEGKINMFTTVGNESYTSLYTNNLKNKILTLQTIEDARYTLTVGYVEGSDYALVDLQTGNIISLVEGTTYNFVAQPNSMEERFQVICTHHAPTSMDKVVNNKAAKGIFTPLGQYMGESSSLNNLPSGIYFVDGIKVVK